MVLGAHLLRHQAGVAELISIALVVSLITDRESLHRIDFTLGEERCVRAGVEASGEEDADRNVAHLPELHRRPQLRQQTLRDLLLARVGQRLDVIPYVPVAFFSKGAVSSHPKPRSRAELAD